MPYKAEKLFPHPFLSIHAPFLPSSSFEVPTTCVWMLSTGIRSILQYRKIISLFRDVLQSRCRLLLHLNVIVYEYLLGLSWYSVNQVTPVARSYDGKNKITVG